VVLVHYDELSDDLAGRMRRLAGTLGISVPEHRWPELVEAATFGAMKRHADRLAPDPVGVLKDKSSFFRRGTSGERRALPPTILSRYRARASELAPPDLLQWLHGGRP